MIYNGITISREEAVLLVQLFGHLVYKTELFKWMHEVCLIEFFDELRQTLRDPIDDHIECYHDD
jgi:hypothetical protein